jgi:hypothetical protein
MALHDDARATVARAWLAERVGFEPTVPQGDTTVFETVPFNRSGTSPCLRTHGATGAALECERENLTTPCPPPAMTP